MKIDFVNPGFINIRINNSYLIKELPTIIKQNEAFGRNKTGNNKIALVEFVSVTQSGVREAFPFGLNKE